MVIICCLLPALSSEATDSTETWWWSKLTNLMCWLHTIYFEQPIYIFYLLENLLRLKLINNNFIYDFELMTLIWLYLFIYLFFLAVFQIIADGSCQVSLDRKLFLFCSNSCPFVNSFLLKGRTALWIPHGVILWAWWIKEDQICKAVCTQSCSKTTEDITPAVHILFLVYVTDHYSGNSTTIK